MSETRYRTFAGYNRWANRRLYEFAAHLSPDQYKADRGAFFQSVHGTLNHILVADRIWMRRLSGSGDAPARLDAILFDTFAELAAAREAEDSRIIAFVEGLDEAALARELRYTNSSGASFAQRLDNVFNHQTHHRGQAHALLTHFLGNGASPSLDLVAFQREMTTFCGAAKTHKA